ncbi:MAG: alpha-amylase family glycosyl hydrolase [Candidatus Izemoplasmatales bacterium]
MFKKTLLALTFIFLSFLIIACNDKPRTTVAEELIIQNPTAESGYLADTVQNGTILHAWNWSMTTIESQIEEIAIAGFSTIQISPMQPQKDYFGIASWDSTWWKLYQPLGFSIATENHTLGTKDDLASLVTAANEYGIKIIVDIVANHLAGGDNETLNEDVLEYEPLIYNQNLIRTDNGYASDSSIFQVTRGSLGGFPDLMTESEVVQERVLSLLKEYVDVGVSGFRFDAAKHIETPSDGELASDFWPYVINGVNEYTENLGKDPLYFYGEILNTPGTDRSYEDYLDYMSLTASSTSDSIRNAVISKNLSNLLNTNYLQGVNPSKTVLWAESHDNFAGEFNSTKNINSSNITKTYVINASRKDATTLYFVRPNPNTFMGSIGSYDWQSVEVSEINRFHNYFIGTDEYLHQNEEDFFINERFENNKYGLVIVDLNNTKEVKDIDVVNIPDGAYHDYISNTTFFVEDSKISGTIGDSGVAVIYNNPYQPKPTAYVSDDGSSGSFTSTKTVTIYSYNTTESYYSINGGDKISFTGNIDIELSHPLDNAIVTLEIEAYYEDFLLTKNYTYLKSNVVITNITVNNIPSEFLDKTLVAWVWAEGEEGKWVTGTLAEQSFNFDISPGDDYFLLVAFPEGTTDFTWENKIKQTNDIEIINADTYDGSSLIWN